jgi:ribosomal protein S18 acetylase RimI-like enzyme
MLLDIFGQAEFKQFVDAWNAIDQETSFGVTVSNQLIGYVLVDIHHKIQYLCVDPVFRNSRLGSTLLTRALDALQNAECVRLTTAKDCRLTSWYARFGFSIEKVLTDKAGAFAGADMIRHRRDSSV